MVELDNLTLSYRQHPAVHHLSGCFAAGSLTAIVGPNGAGKSSLLKAIAGLLPGDGGTLRVAVPRARIGYLPQRSDIDRRFPIDVADCVLLGGWSRTGVTGAVTPRLRQRAAEALQTVGLQGFEGRLLGELSAGQLQRVLFARLLVQDADLLLLDEPFNAVDTRTCRQLLPLLLDWHSRGRTVITVLHDHALARAVFPRTLLLAREMVAWGPSAEVLTAGHLQQALAMSEAWDGSAAYCTQDEAIAARAGA